MASWASISRGLLVSCLFLTSLLTSPLQAQDFKADNAAYWYQQAHQEIAERSEEELEIITIYLEAPATMPTKEVRTVLERCQGAIALLKKGAQRQHCDFHLDYAQGVHLLMPHLGPMRTASVLLAADAKANFARGDHKDALSSLMAGYRLTDHISNDRFIISCLISVSNFTRVDQQVKQALDRAVLNADDCDQLLNVTKQLREKDFNFLESVAVEQVAMGDWALREFSEPGTTDLSFEELQIEPLTITQVSLDNDLRGYDQAMDEFMVIFQEDDPTKQERQLAEWSDFVQGGGYGPLAKELTSAFDRLANTINTTNQQLDERIRTLEAIASGRAAPEEKINAALIYKQAFNSYQQIPDDQQSALLERDPGAAYRSDLLIRQEDIDTTVSLLTDAAKLEHCDFSVLLSEPNAPFGPWYAAAMRDGLRAMLIRAGYHLANKRFHETAANLRSAYAMIQHLSNDQRLLCAMVAQQSMREANSILARLISEDPAQLIDNKLKATITQMSLSDPFGYLLGLKHDTSEIRYWTAQDDQSAPSMSVTEVLNFMALIDTLAQAGTQTNEIQWTSVDSMPRIIDLVAFEQIRKSASQLALLVKTRDIQMILDSGLPDVAPVAQRKQEARADARQAWTLIRHHNQSKGGAVSE